MRSNNWHEVLKDLSMPHNEHRKKNVKKNVTHCFILIGKELPIHWLTTADLFREVYLRPLNVLPFRKGHVVTITPNNQWCLKTLTVNRLSFSQIGMAGGRADSALLPVISVWIVQLI